MCNIMVMMVLGSEWDPKRKKTENKIKNVFEEIMAENFQNLKNIFRTDTQNRKHRWFQTK